MELRNKFIINSLIGLVLGLIVGIIFLTVMPGSSKEGFTLYLIMSGLHGMIPVGAATVYDIESWGVTKSTIVHALITLATIVAIEIPLKWWGSISQFAVACVVYVIIYALIWMINYLYWKRAVKDMNEQLGRIHHDPTENTQD